MNKPDKWLIIKTPECYKLFGTWNGGYLHGASWRINSGIVEITEDDTHYYFYGASGSCYMCNKKTHGVTPYGASILSGFGDKITVLREEESLEWIATQL